jgi:hypothetical protein
MSIIGRKSTPNVTVQLMEPAPGIKRVGLAVTVDDQQVRRGHPGFDGMERVFALVPRGQPGCTSWQRVELRYNRTIPANPQTATPLVDDHEAYLNGDGFDFPAIRREGVAFGMDTNVGTLWLQTRGKNFPPR